MLSLVLTVTLTSVSIFLVLYFWSRRHLYVLANSLPGPIALPIVGNGLSFRGDYRDFLYKFEKMIDSYPHPMRVWMGHHLMIISSHPSHIEKILMSSKIAHKHDMYRFLKCFIGNGLISSSGAKWKQHRKLLRPLLNLKYVQDSVQIFEKHTDLFVKRLDVHVDQPKFDVLHYLHDFCTDIISESILGTKMNAQKEQNREFNKAFNDIYEILISRISKPWLQVDFIFNASPYKKMQNKIISVMEQYLLPLLESAQKTHPLNDQQYVPLIRKVAEVKLQNQNQITDKDFYDHMATFFAASEDTVATAAAFACLCFGMCPEKQQNAFDEIKFVLKNQNRDILYEDLAEFRYLEMCIKEVLRLFPIATYILRKTTRDFQIGDHVLPENCCVLIPIYRLHRSAEYWEKPEEFYPEHFLPEAVENRNDFVYIPFSMGPRGCIGQTFAYAALKVLLVNLLKHYEIRADGKCKDIKLSTDISVRSINGYNIQLKRRIWL